MCMISQGLNLINPIGNAEEMAITNILVTTKKKSYHLRHYGWT